MKTRKKGYWILFIITIICTIAAISTVIPSSSASKESLLGYKSHCSFAPISTIMCLLFSAITCIIRKRLFTVKS